MIDSTSQSHLDPVEARRRQQAGGVLVDVREAHEWVAGHAVDARHLPLGRLPQQAHELPRDRDLRLICASGSRSKVATDLLRARGYRAFNVAGGFQAWSRAGLPVERPEGSAAASSRGFWPFLR